MRRQRIRVRLGFGWVVSAAAGWGRAWGVWAGPGLVWMHSVVFACGCSLLVAGNLSSIAAQSVVVGDDDDAVGCCVARGEVAGGRLRGSPPDRASCSSCAGDSRLSRSFVEMCFVSCLNAMSEYICGWETVTWGCSRSPCSRDSPVPLYSTTGGWL